MLRRLFLLLAMHLLTFPAAAQEALELPADLFVLLNDGRIQRYGVGASGVRTVTPEGAYIIDFGVDSLGERRDFGRPHLFEEIEHSELAELHERVLHGEYRLSSVVTPWSAFTFADSI